MNFDFTDDQKMLADQFQRRLSDLASSERRRTFLESGESYDALVWRSLVEGGFVGVCAPDAFGGAGLGYAELCALAEEAGRGVICAPFSTTVYGVIEALKETGSPAQMATYLPRLVSGDWIGAFALTSPLAANEPTLSFTDGKLSGTVNCAHYGDCADILVAAAASPARPNGPPILVLVNLNSDGVTRRRAGSIDEWSPCGRLTFDKAPAESLDASAGANGAVDRLLDRLATPYAFEMLGVAEAALEMARDYALTRHAFGRPIGSFQAVKRRLVDAYVEIEIARSNAYYAAWALENNDPNYSEAAALAYASAARSALRASEENNMVHGGVSFTWEADCHFYFKRAKFLSLILGGEYAWKERLVRALEGNLGRRDEGVKHGL